MYSFQEVHTYTPGDLSSRSQWDIIHDDTGIRSRYFGKDSIAANQGDWPYVMEEFYKMDRERRVAYFQAARKLPMKKINFPDLPQVVDLSIQGPQVTTAYDFSGKPFNYFTFGDCKPAPTPKDPYNNLSDFVEMVYGKQNKEQGINPMAYDTKVSSTAAVASIINAASDESKQRDFLMVEFDRIADRTWNDPVYTMLSEMFNLNAPKTPKTSQGLLDAFKSGAFTVDQKKVDLNAKFLSELGGDFEDRYDDDDSYIGERYYGITFTGLPVADQKGYNAALEEYALLKKMTKRKIIVGSPAEGLAALEAMEAWTPSNAPAPVAA